MLIIVRIQQDPDIILKTKYYFMNFSTNRLSQNLASNNFKSVLYVAGSFVTSLLIKKVLEETWERTQGTPAPKDPSDFTTPVKGALVWTLALAVFGSLGKFLYRTYVPKPK